MKFFLLIVLVGSILWGCAKTNGPEQPENVNQFLQNLVLKKEQRNIVEMENAISQFGKDGITDLWIIAQKVVTKEAKIADDLLRVFPKCSNRDSLKPSTEIKQLLSKQAMEKDLKNIDKLKKKIYQEGKKVIADLWLEKPKGTTESWLAQCLLKDLASLIHQNREEAIAVIEKLVELNVPESIILAFENHSYDIRIIAVKSLYETNSMNIVKIIVNQFERENSKPVSGSDNRLAARAFKRELGLLISELLKIEYKPEWAKSFKQNKDFMLSAKKRLKTME